ncbi:MAG: DUF1015 domain-containing protein [Deltaproteobacteria bacterium]|nr:DUF1015 domain-containing protein [Deltaproteobacteria bacterium]
MTDVRPFRALRYDPERVDLSRVIVPPYDVISPEERVSFWERDPHCAIRLILTKDAEAERDADYDDVARLIAEWREAGVLAQDDEPAIYGLRQRFTAPDGAELVREAFFAALHLEDYESRVVLPHERTMTGPKADRLKLLRATGANLSSIFLLYEDPDDKFAGTLAPAFEAGPTWRAVDAAGTEHSLTRISDAGVIEAVRHFLADRPVVIADGHHRYETAVANRDVCRTEQPDAGADAPFEFTLGCFANAYAAGSLLLPIHRVIPDASLPDDTSERLAGWSETRVEVAGAEDVPAALAEHLAPLAPAPAFAADDGSGVLRVFVRDESDGDLAIRVVHREVIEGVFGLDEAAVSGGAIRYGKNTLQAARDARNGVGLVLYVNALSPDDVFRVTGAGEILPQKSTFFVPKLPTGLVFRLLEDG